MGLTKSSKIKIGNSKLNPDGWQSAYVKPCGKFWKRQASKKARKSKLFDGNYYKKVWGWFEWC